MTLKSSSNPLPPSVSSPQDVLNLMALAHNFEISKHVSKNRPVYWCRIRDGGCVVQATSERDVISAVNLAISKMEQRKNPKLKLNRGGA